ncbi:MAG: TraR/DksA C4-type zinc finger protein [Candidatus Eisenbacteria bacterium]
MAIDRKKLVAKPAPKTKTMSPKAMALMSPGKGKPAAKKPAAKPVKAGAKSVVKPVIKSSVAKPAAKPAPVKAAAKPVAKPAPPKPVAKPTPVPVKPAAKPAAKAAPAPPKPVVLNKGAAAAKAMAEARIAAKIAAEKARAPKLVPATPGAIRPGAVKAAPAKGKAASRPPAEVRPLGVLPPESMAKSKPAPTQPRVIIPARPVTPSPSPVAAARPGSRGDERLNEDDLKHFETKLLTERARIMGEMGHLENTILKVNPRDSAGEVGGYSFHMADAGTDSMEREISFDIASKEGRLLREINDALRRIYTGVYGICEASGKNIARARLEALPWARYTVEEQENIEKKQRAGRMIKEEE